MINHNENENDSEKLDSERQTDPGVGLDKSILNIKNVLVICLYVLGNILATLEAQLIKKLSNIEVELKKTVAYKEKLCIPLLLLMTK